MRSRLRIAIATTLLGVAQWTAVAVSSQSDAIAQSTIHFAQAEELPVAAAQRQVSVYFPVRNSADFTQVRAVRRTTTQPAIARFAIQQLIAGPTTAEQRQGLMSALRMQGRSNCGQDFTLTISRGIARLQFCRPVISGGIGDDARATSSINATLKQFSTVSRVVILDREGNCLGDQSGENFCLRGR